MPDAEFAIGRELMTWEAFYVLKTILNENSMDLEAEIHQVRIRPRLVYWVSCRSKVLDLPAH